MAKTIALGAALSMLLYGSGFLVFLSPLPIFYVHMFYGKKAGVVSAFFAMAMLVVAYVVFLPMAAGYLEKWPALNLFVALPGAGLAPSFSFHAVQGFGIGYYLYYIMIGLLLGEGVSRKWNAARWIGYSTLLPLLAIAATFLLMQTVLHADIIGGLKSYMTVVIDEMVKAKGQFGSSSQLDILKQYSAQIIDVSVRIVPATIVISTFFVVVGNALIGRWLSKQPAMFSHLPEVRNWRVPDHLVWAVIISGALFFADVFIVNTGWLKYFAINLLIVLAGVYFIHGLIIVSFLLKTRPLLIKIFVYAGILLFFQVMGLIFIALGFTDLWFDFRRLDKTVKVKGKDLKKETELWK